MGFLILLSIISSCLRLLKVKQVLSSRCRPSCTTASPVNISLSQTIQTGSGDTMKRAAWIPKISYMLRVTRYNVRRRRCDATSLREVYDQGVLYCTYVKKNWNSQPSTGLNRNSQVYRTEEVQPSVHRTELEQPTVYRTEQEQPRLQDWRGTAISPQDWTGTANRLQDWTGTAKSTGLKRNRQQSTELN